MLRVLLTIKLDKTFCLVSVPGPVRGANLDNAVIGAADDDNWVKLSFKVREQSWVHILEVGKKLGVPWTLYTRALDVHAGA